MVSCVRPRLEVGIELPPSFLWSNFHCMHCARKRRTSQMTPWPTRNVADNQLIGPQSPCDRELRVEGGDIWSTTVSLIQPVRHDNHIRGWSGGITEAIWLPDRGQKPPCSEGHVSG